MHESMWARLLFTLNVPLSLFLHSNDIWYKLPQYGFSSGVMENFNVTRGGHSPSNSEVVDTRRLASLSLLFFEPNLE